MYCQDDEDDVIDLTLDDDDNVVLSPSKKAPKKGSKAQGKKTSRGEQIDDSSSDRDSMDDDDETVDDSDEEAENPFKADMLDGFKDFVDSAKTTEMIRLLQEWRADAPDDKTVVYSQWTSCMDCECTSPGEHRDLLMLL